MLLLNSLRKLGIGYRISLGILTFGTASLFSFQTSGFQDGPILCLFRNSTGLPCPFCGTTRSIGSILQGDFGSAVELNPLGFLVIAGAVFMFLTPERLISVNQRVATKWWQLSQREQIFFVLVSLCLIWSLNLPRMV
ncbi:MAG: DUF2752 domain-containing protein [Actinobacteria bacterium]|nr:DUF2752 domain-containing protein [Actinomycetota bacterium]